MNINVVVIGPQDLINLVLKVGASYPEINLIPAPYTHEQETLEVVKKNTTKADVLLFAGNIPYQIVKSHPITDTPMAFIQLTGTALYRTLFKVLTETKLNPTQTSFRISMDTLKKTEVDECLEELELHTCKLFLNKDKKVDELVDFHYQMWINKEIDVAITCVTSVYEALKSLGVLVYRVIPTKSTVRSTLQNMIAERKSFLQKSTQIAVGVLRFNHLFTTSDVSEYALKRKKAGIQSLLIDFSEEAQAIFDWSNRDEVRFITTRGAIETITQTYKKLPLLNNLCMKVGIEPALGIGLGYTANEAETNAREALLKAQSLASPSCFVLDLDGTLYGPVGQEKQLQYSLRSDDPVRIHLAKTSNLSVATINKLLSFCENFGYKGITALDLAAGLGLTIRSARRILNTLERNKLAAITGEEQPIHRGRPRNLYELYLIDEKTTTTP
ncbi:transcriptional regulator [Bacillus megaterium]|uniref:transcriptional regulator n=1 Tax=Priestia megaterium TaxID=1404 RepID=UPI001293AD22|nr:transcriptional regulator [Priestia megaterium]MQR86930.1 transcriptional regulator [Priestia megaterium]